MEPFRWQFDLLFLLSVIHLPLRNNKSFTENLKKIIWPPVQMYLPVPITLILMNY